MVGSESIHLPTISHIGQSGGEVARLPMQENHSDCSRVAQHALVLGSSDHLPNLPNLLTAIQSGPSQKSDNLNPHAGLLEPQQSRSRACLRQWQQELRLLKRGSIRSVYEASGPFLQSDVSFIRWTLRHSL